MLKLVLVDDEPMVRAGIKKMLSGNVRWQVVGEALNGKQAMRQIRQLKPDVVISDIRMPEFDGLELLQAVPDVNPDILVILLTGYPDFDYAQQAVRFGAFDYIVKPSRAQDIMAVLDKAEQAITRKRNERQHIADDQSRLDRYKKFVSEKLLFDLLHGEEIDARAYDVPLLLSFRQITVIAWSTGMADSPKPHLHRVLGSVAHDSSITARREQDGDWILVIGWDDAMTDSQRQQKLLESADFLKDQIARCGHGWRIGISNTGGFEEAAKLYNQSKLALYRTVTEQRILRYADLPGESLSNRIVPLELQFSLLKAVESGDQEAAITKFMQMKRYLERFHLARVTQEVVQFHDQLATIASNSGIPSHPADNPCFVKFGSISEAVGWLEQQIRRHAGLIESAGMVKIDPVVRRVLRIIHNQYTADMKLADCAAAIGISPNYLSTLFKQQMGLSFSDYLCRIRVQKAKSLLLQRNHKVYEVAQRLGYVDGRHFSQIFKKATGTTPVEYRQLNGVALDE